MVTIIPFFIRNRNGSPVINHHHKFKKLSLGEKSLSPAQSEREAFNQKLAIKKRWSMKFGFLIVPRWSTRESVELYEIAERMGFEYGWLADYANSRSLYPILTAIALSTKKMKIGPCVTNPFTRHPAITATSIATLDELSGGRALLGIAAGDEALLHSLGIERKSPYDSLKEAIEIIRKIMAGEKVNYQGKTFKIEDFSLFYKPERVAPVYIGARGKRLLKLAGEIGDGVLLDLSHPLEIEMALEQVKKGLREKGRKIEEFDFAACPIFSVDSDAEKAKDPVRWMAALIASNASPDLLERHDISQESAMRVRDALFREGLEKGAALTTDEMLEAFSIAGDIDYCIEKLEMLKKTGLTQIILANVDFVHENVKKQLELIGEEILPRFL
jgi:5,10-methylenetetrahydromethanopterin reductase